MNRETLWKLYCERNPKFAKEGANFTSKGLRDFFERVYAMGFQEGRGADHRECRHDFDNVFREIFTP